MIHVYELNGGFRLDVATTPICSRIISAKLVAAA